MKRNKEEFREHCLHIEEETICDTCGTNLDMYDIPIELQFYGTDYDFCNLKCLSIFINEELKKSEEK
jgi:hypothetical protein